MIRQWLMPGLLETGTAGDGVLAIRDAMVNLFVVRGPAGLVCVDAGFRRAAVARGFSRLGLDRTQVAAVFLTHTHWDHARGAAMFPNARVHVGEAELPFANKTPLPQRLRGGQVVSAAGLAVRVVATPGHTLGSVSYVVNERLLFTGDALRLQRGRVVPNWLARDRELMKQSIRTLAGIENVECLLTGHTGLACDVKEAFREFRK